MFRQLRRTGACWVLLALCISAQRPRHCDAQTASTAARVLPERAAIAIDPTKFGEGWSQSVSLGAASGDQYELWVKDGWLQVRRRNDRGVLDWQIALARLAGPRPPTVFNDDGFEVSYRDGRYFIRDTGDVLRSVREPTDAKACSPRAAFFGEQVKSTGSSKSLRKPVLSLSVWEQDRWSFVASGPDDAHFSAVVRLAPIRKPRPASGWPPFSGVLGWFDDDTRFLDDGELLVAIRVLEEQYKSELATERLNKTFPDSIPAKIDASGWLNTQDAPSWDKLKGKVVLLDFWTASAADSAKRQRQVQQIAEKYRERGLIVVGIHPADDAAKSKAFVAKQGITFPIAIDSGKTAERFAIDEWPSLFLIDESGKIVSGYSDKVPADGEIEQLFASERLRKNFPDLIAPTVDASSWLNTAAPLPWGKLKGKVVLLDFWGTWCGPCVAKLPEVQTFANKYRDRGVAVIGIHSSRAGETCKDFIAKRGITFPIAIDSGKTAKSFAVEDWPALFLIDRTGKVVRGYIDELPKEDEIDELLRN